MVHRRNVLIFHSGALGDFVLTWPLALAAGRVYAQSRVIYVTASQKGALAEQALRVESADAEAGWHTLHSDRPELPERSGKLLSGAHLVFGFGAAPGDLWTRNIAALAPGTQVVCLQTRPADDAPPMHVTEHVRGQLESTVPVLHAAMGQMLRSIGERGISGVRENHGGSVVIHPGSGAARKCWPVEHFVELTRRLSAARHRVRFVLGEVELEQWPSERIERIRASAEVVQPGTYLELYDAISSARAFVGNDSGPTHLAAMCGVRTLALFGTDPTRWAPVGPRVSIVRGETIESIGVDSVEAALTASL